MLPDGGIRFPPVGTGSAGRSNYQLQNGADKGNHLTDAFACRRLVQIETSPLQAHLGRYIHYRLDDGP